jgi:hypothetical protein
MTLPNYPEERDEADEADEPDEAQPDWTDFSPKYLQPDQSQPFGDKTPDDLRD